MIQGENAMNDFERIKNDAAIEEVIGTYIRLKKTGKTFAALCPFHEEKTPSFKVYPATQSYCCYGCGAAGDAIDFVEDYTGVDAFEALKVVATLTGLPQPEPRKKNNLAIAREDAVAALWEACPIPTQGFVRRLADLGWHARRYDPLVLEATSQALGPVFEQVDQCGLAHIERSGALNHVSFKPYENAWILAGQRVHGNGPAVTGFVVFTENKVVRVVQRLTSTSSAPCLLINQKAIDNRLKVAEVFVTDDPLRGMQANRRFAAASPAYATWRPQDVRSLRSAFPNATFILDINHISDTSLLEWVLQMGRKAVDLKCIGDMLDPAESPVPALSKYVGNLTVEFTHLEDGECDDRVVKAMRATSRATALLDAMSSAPETKTVFGAAIASAGMPVTYSVEVPAMAPVTARKPALAPVTSQFQAPGAAAHLLETALLHLQVLDAQMWAAIPVSAFGDHAPMAAAIGRFLSDTRQYVEPHATHAAFWSYAQHLCDGAPLPPSMIAFWQERLVANPDYWARPVGKNSYDARIAADEMRFGLQHFITQLAKQTHLDLARAAQIDCNAEEQLLATYASSAFRYA